jgi:predicted metal-dependent peptidase
MSSEIRKNVSFAVVKEEDVSSEKKAQCLQTAIYETSKSHAFLGSVLQCLNIAYSHVLPTAGIMFNTDAKRWDMFINPKWFCDRLLQANRKAVLLHELSHITHKHPTRVPFLKISQHKRHLMNIAMDMAINQYIKDLPKGCQQCPPDEQRLAGAPCPNKECPGYCIFVEDFFDFDAKGNKVPWQHNMPMEHYYEKLLQRFEESDNQDGEGEQEGRGGGSGKGKPKEFDSHHWEANSEEAEMLDATEELMKRAMVKQGLSYDELPLHVRQLLDDIKVRRSELNYRGLIMSALKRSVSGHDRKNSWSRRSKRFGNKAPGTTVSDLPFLDMHIDTSGSISIEEANEFLEIVDGFLKSGSRKCRLNLFHTKVYYSKEYKLGNRLDRSQIQSGGTDLDDSCARIAQSKPDLAVFLTDGCYGDVDTDSMLPKSQKFPQCLFIISKDGSPQHPLARLGQTVQVPRSKSLKADKDLESK